MDYISVKEASQKFEISERRIQKLCENQRIEGSMRVSGVWLIPKTANKPSDERFAVIPSDSNLLSLSDLCDKLSISLATGRNWIKLGKIKPTYTEKKNLFFSKEYFSKLQEDLTTGKNIALKSRRNKKYVSGNSLYNSYVSDNCKNLNFIQSLLESIEKENIDLTEEIIQYLITDCALHLFNSKNLISTNSNKVLLEEFIKGAICIDKYDSLFKDLLENKQNALQFCQVHSQLFSYNYIYEPNEDILGLLYISCKNIGNRKATGAYYTPTSVVKKLISQTNIQESKNILDPCCGTGNFLLQLPDKLKFENVYGNDIDKISVKITRLNMALKFETATVDTICSHITESNFLENFDTNGFEYIIGNPPWGFEFSENEKVCLRKKYEATKNSNIESYDIFIEQSLRLLAGNGQLAFVLPEAILNVKAHSDVRKIIVQTTNIKGIDYLGNAFDGVQCPCIILRLEKTGNSLSTLGMKINDGKKTFTINTERQVFSEYFSFLTTDEEYSILHKIRNLRNTTTLAGQADFALGIVTGNNKEYISNLKSPTNEIVLKGSDICKYHIKPAENYIEFRPESFQQVAPTGFYRTKEKLLYRFISSQFVFAYDNKQTLSLNSCNILIPKIPNLNIKYVLSILNSRMAQFIYRKEFNSVKVLRSHIENIPIPIIDNDIQQQLISIVDLLIKGQSLEDAEKLYNEIDLIICELFNLSSDEQKIIKSSVDAENKFLI